MLGEDLVCAKQLFTFLLFLLLLVPPSLLAHCVIILVHLDDFDLEIFLLFAESLVRGGCRRNFFSFADRVGSLFSGRDEKALVTETSNFSSC